MSQYNIAQRFTTADGRVWEKVCESKPSAKVEGLLILYIAHDIQCGMIMKVYEGHVHDAVMPEDRVLYRNIMTGDMYAIPTMDFEKNFTPAC